TITATALDGSGNPTSVTASTSVTNLPGSPAQLTATSPTVSVTVAQQTNLQVTVLDAAGNAITSQPQVRFAAPAPASPPVADGTFSGVSTIDVAASTAGTATATLLANTKA